VGNRQDNHDCLHTIQRQGFKCHSLYRMKLTFFIPISSGMIFDITKLTLVSSALDSVFADLLPVTRVPVFVLWFDGHYIVSKTSIDPQGHLASPDSQILSVVVDLFSHARHANVTPDFCFGSFGGTALKVFRHVLQRYDFTPFLVGIARNHLILVLPQYWHAIMALLIVSSHQRFP